MPKPYLAIGMQAPMSGRYVYEHVTFFYPFLTLSLQRGENRQFFGIRGEKLRDVAVAMATTFLFILEADIIQLWK